MPEGLGEAGQALWRSVTDGFEVQAHQHPVLLAACRESDRAEQAEADLRTDGPYVSDRYGGLRAHPGVAVARSSRLAVARLLRTLNLEPPEEHPGPGNWRRGLKR
jgi:hypothetical protein